MCSTALCWICFAALETAVADVCPQQLPLHMSSAAATACQWLLLQQDQLLHLWLWGRQINIAQANSARTLHVLSNFQSKCLTRTKSFPTHCKTGNWEHTETPQSYPQHCSVIHWYAWKFVIINNRTIGSCQLCIQHNHWTYSGFLTASLKFLPFKCQTVINTMYDIYLWDHDGSALKCLSRRCFQ